MANNTSSFVCAVMGISTIKDSDDLFVNAKVKGTIKTGTEFNIFNFNEIKQKQTKSTVVSLEIQNNPILIVTDSNVKIRVKDGKNLNLRIGTVLFTDDILIKDIEAAYVNAIGDYYISEKQFTLNDEDLEKMSMTDMAEAWRLLIYFVTKNKELQSEENSKIWRGKLDKLAHCLCDRILNSEEIYVVFDKRTDEPHLFSKTLEFPNKKVAISPPDILIITTPYLKKYNENNTNENLEVRRIANNEDKTAIRDFLGGVFYFNGAIGVEVVYDNVAINNQMLVAPPDFKNVPKQNIPVMNPDVMRFILLIGQLSEAETEESKKKFALYYDFLFREIKKANFLIPVKNDGNLPKPDKDGKITLEKGMGFRLAFSKGKSDKGAVKMFTDWKRFRMEFDDSWGALVQPVSAMIENHDCVINQCKFQGLGCYITKEMYDNAIAKENLNEKNSDK
ncbi:hypothetical protein SAMN02910289_01907 [Lachnospiraceae bacterium RM5]|nr:hypothetical protein SAMN02910289_01907 [Lachnospiraceae bacterium RM5]